MPGLDPTGGIISGVSEGLGAIEGGVQLFSNLANERRDKAALNSLQRPFYTIQNEYYQNRNQSGQLAEGGLPTATKDFQTSENQRGLGAGVSGILQSGGNPNDISKLFDTFNRSIDRTGAADAEQHIKNIQYFQKANSDLAAQKNIQFGVNKLQPYEEKLKQLSENISTDKQNAYGGANSIIGSTGALGTSLSNNTLLNKLFGSSSPTVDPGLNTSTSAVGSIQTGNAAPDLNTTPTYIDPNMTNPQLNYINPFQ